VICRADHATPLYPQKMALTSPTSGGRSVLIVRSRKPWSYSYLGQLFVAERTPLPICYLATDPSCYNSTVACNRCRRNAFIEPLPSNDKRDLVKNAIEMGSVAIKIFFFWKDPIYLQSVIIHSANGGKGEGWHVEEYSVALLC
jgi:hypothetical protein